MLKRSSSTRPKPAPPPILEPFNLSSFRVNLDVEITQEVIFTIQDKVILTKGSLLVLTGKPKARKSTFLQAFLGSAIKKQRIWGIESHIEDDGELILVDTEQSLYDLQQSLKRLENAINIPLANHPRFVVYSARSCDVGDIIRMLDSILETHPKCKVLAIDGLIDLVNDINDVTESKMAIHYIKKICDAKQIGVIGIIHQNKATNFSMGHLGAFASRHAQSELAITKNDDGSSTMNATYLRSADNIDPIEINYDALHQRYDLSRNINVPIDYITREWVEQVFEGRPGLTYRELLMNGKKYCRESQYHLEKKIIPILYAENIIEKRGNVIQITRKT
jgi:AAA domain